MKLINLFKTQHEILKDFTQLSTDYQEFKNKEKIKVKSSFEKIYPFIPLISSTIEYKGQPLRKEGVFLFTFKYFNYYLLEDRTLIAMKDNRRRPKDSVLDENISLDSLIDSKGFEILKNLFDAINGLFEQAQKMVYASEVNEEEENNNVNIVTNQNEDNNVVLVHSSEHNSSTNNSNNQSPSNRDSKFNNKSTNNRYTNNKDSSEIKNNSTTKPFDKKNKPGYEGKKVETSKTENEAKPKPESKSEPEPEPKVETEVISTKEQIITVNAESESQSKSQTESQTESQTQSPIKMETVVSTEPVENTSVSTSSDNSNIEVEGIEVVNNNNNYNTEMEAVDVEPIIEEVTENIKPNDALELTLNNTSNVTVADKKDVEIIDLTSTQNKNKNVDFNLDESMFELPSQIQAKKDDYQTLNLDKFELELELDFDLPTTVKEDIIEVSEGVEAIDNIEHQDSFEFKYEEEEYNLPEDADLFDNDDPSFENAEIENYELEETDPEFNEENELENNLNNIENPNIEDEDYNPLEEENLENEDLDEDFKL